MSNKQQFTPVHGTTSAHGDLARNWNRLRPQVQERWPQLTQDDIDMIDGDARKLSALVQQRTGTELREIEKEIESLLNRDQNAEQSLNKQTASSSSERESGERAASNFADSSTMAGAAQRARHTVADGYQQVQRQLAAAPITSSGVAFATGSLIGLVIASMFKDVESQSRKRHYFSRDFW